MGSLAYEATLLTDRSFMTLTALRQHFRARSKRIVEVAPPADAGVDLDLTLPEWDSARDLAEDFDLKMESFMAFDDGDTGSEREWLMG